MSRPAAGGQMNIAITMIEPTASNAATAAAADASTSPKPIASTGTPSVRAKGSSKVEIVSGRQKIAAARQIAAAAIAMRPSSGGSVASAPASNSDSQPTASNQIRLSRLP